MEVRLRIVLAVVLIGVSAPIQAQDTAPRSAADSFHLQRVQPFFAKHCIDCHGPDVQEGELRLDTLAADFVTRQPAASWVEVLDRLNLGEMPPADEERPNADELVALTDWISAELRRVQSQANSTGGRVLLRRLSRTEYTNTVRDLLGVSFIEGEGPMEMLPPDGTLQGFNKVSKALLLDPSLLETYFRTAEFVVDKAVATRPPSVPTRTLRFEFEDTGGAIAYQLDRRSMWKDRNGLYTTEGGARTFAQLRHPFNDKQTPIDGEYLIRVRAGADPGQRDEPIYMDISKGAAGTLARIRVDATPDDPQVYEIRRVLNAALGGELNVALVDGTRTYGENTIGREARTEIEKLFNSGKEKESFRMRARRRAEGAFDTYTRSNIRPETLDLESLPKLYLDYIEVEGPLNGRWPPESRRRLFESSLGGDRWKLGEQSADGMTREQMVTAARQIVARLLPRAFRREVRVGEVNAIADLVVAELDAEQPFEEALKVGLIATLCSPDFLYLFEPDRNVLANGEPVLGEERSFTDRRARIVKGRIVAVEEGRFVLQRSSDGRKFTVKASSFSRADQGYFAALAKAVANEASDQAKPVGQRQLTDFELASRLSYFLWSSMPDDELFREAKAGRLQQPANLNRQIDRMLADARSEALVSDFAAQWLRLQEFDRFEPDRQIFPGYYANEFSQIGEEMKAEPLAFFREVLREDLSVLSFLDSDWTMANEKLARWYGIEGVTGKELQRVSLPNDSPRGGLLGMAGVHKWGSDGSRTKPVERGKYVLDVLFNDPPPPPPPNAGEVEPNIRGENLTVRERLAKHRHVPTCANCHRRIDPYGLALENFNVIGQWRDEQDGEKPPNQWGNNRKPIDPSGTLPNGHEFANVAEFKRAMRAQSDRFLTGLAEKMFVYALGRSVDASDRPTIDELVTHTKANEHTFNALIKGVVASKQFRSK